METKFDIIIIGGGIAGCISAMYLQQKYTICIVDKPIITQSGFGESLIASSKRIFRELSILDKISSLDDTVLVPAIGMKSYWGSVQPQYTDSIRNPEGDGWVINKSLFNQELHQMTRSFGCSFILAKIQTIVRKSDEWEVGCDQSLKLKARFIIDASGRTNVLRNKFLLKKDNIDLLTCFAATIAHTSNMQLSSIVPDQNGWWYSSPLPDSKRLISYYTDSDLWDKKTTKSSDFIYHILRSNQVLANQLELGDLIDYQYIATKAANTSILETISGTHWVAIGDASICLDPLSSRGMYNAMVMAAQVSKLMIATDIVFNTSLENDRFFHQQIQGYAHRIMDTFRKQHHEFYSMETRWSQFQFWSRRQKPNM